jgi:WD40 repeat protein
VCCKVNVQECFDCIFREHFGSFSFSNKKMSDNYNWGELGDSRKLIIPLFHNLDNTYTVCTGLFEIVLQKTSYIHMSRFTSTKSVGLSQAAGSISMTDERAPVMDNLDSLDPSLERTFRGHKSVVTSVAFKPDLKQIASGSSDCS